MKILGKSIALAVAGTALAAVALATPAAADSSQLDTIGTITIHTRGDGTQPPSELGDPEEWGVVELAIDDSAGSVTPRTIVEVGGGKWSYGWKAVTGGKYCYSNYYHSRVKHGSTVKIAGHTVKDTAAAGYTSNANKTAGGAYTCKAYYSK
ncbi:lactococcin 972 family bacteriocin [Streptomyces sp. NPDC058257]|uniref:lactococcin 972 family bacteriocin n=1 Tax=Streptomyces sp. NPDC058257 TaxID=3346409 RepID=UPI0036E01B88